jgi:hypothetical protein
MRAGFNSFLDSLVQSARQKNVRWDIILCGSRNQAFEDFEIALRRHPDAFNVLLVDSEGEVVLAPWEHLRRQEGVKIPKLDGEHCHLMAQAMEAWIIADPEALESYYGKGFHRSAIPRREDVEAIPKADLFKALNRATNQTEKGAYQKVDHGAELLKRIDPRQVRSRARHCDLFFKALEARLKR